MQGFRGLWSVGLALSLTGCAGAGPQRVAGTSAPSPSSPLASARERMTTRLIAWRQRLAPKGVALKVDPAKVEEPVEETTASVTKARVKAGDAWRPRNDASADRLSHYFPMRNRKGEARAKAAPDGPPERDLWAESARVALARNGIDLPARAGGGRSDDPSVLPVAMEVGTTGTTVRPRLAAPVTNRRARRPVVTTATEHDAEAMPALVEAGPGARVERTSAEGVAVAPAATSASDSPPAVQHAADPSPGPLPDPDEAVTRTRAETYRPAPAPAPEPAPAPAPQPAPEPAPAPESAPIPAPAPAPKPADEPVPPAGVAGETVPEPPPAAATGPEPHAETPHAEMPSSHPAVPEMPMVAPSPVLHSKSMPAPVPSKSLPLVAPSKSLPPAAPSKVVPAAQDQLTSGSHGPAGRPAVARRRMPAGVTTADARTATAAGRPRMASAPVVSPYGTSIDPAAAPATPYPASFFVNPGADSAHRAMAGTADPALKASILPAPGAQAASTYWGRPAPRRRTILSRLIARFQGDKPAAAEPSSVAGAEPRDIAEGGRDVQRVAAERLGEPAQR